MHFTMFLPSRLSFLCLILKLVESIPPNIDALLCISQSPVINNIHGYVDDSGSTVKFKMFYVSWTSVRQKGNKLPPYKESNALS